MKRRKHYQVRVRVAGKVEKLKKRSSEGVPDTDSDLVKHPTSQHYNGERRLQHTNDVENHGVTGNPR